MARNFGATALYNRRTPNLLKRMPHDNGQHNRRRIAVVMGTRPEAIKLAPVVRALETRPAEFETVLVSTGQHREMLDQALELMRLEPQHDLGLMEPAQSPARLAARALERSADLFEQLRPDVVIVQGDTTTAMAASLAAFHLGIPVAHVEAGLRTDDPTSPFPEEMNRRITSQVATWHYAPTKTARENLLASGIASANIRTVGNTIVDALQSIDLATTPPGAATAVLLADPRRLVLLTAHRRESFGEPLRRICRAVRQLSELHADVQFVFPVHLNPAVATLVHEELDGLPGVRLIDPVDYRDLLHLLRRSVLVMTDSGGIQEEAPSLGTPVIVLRDRTERPELIEAGAGRLAGTDQAAIVAIGSRLLASERARSEMIVATNPFGDGHAAERIAEHLSTVLSARIQEHTS